MNRFFQRIGCLTFAHELSKGEAANIVDTLARVLDDLGRQEEALKLLHEAMPRFTKGRDKTMLDKCLKDVQGH